MGFLSPTSSPVYYKLRDFPFMFRIFFLAFTSPLPITRLFRGAGTVELEGETGLGGCSTLIVCFICGLAKALGLLAPTPAVPETWCLHIPGKESRSRSRAIPLMELGTQSLGSSGHISCSWLLQKRSHLIRSCPAWQGPSEAAEIRSSVATCETLLARRQLGFGIPCTS